MNKNYKFILGDCLEKMKDIEDKSVNLVLIDPPYNIGKDTWDKWKTVDKYVEFMGEVFLEIQRVLKDNGNFYFFHNDFLQIVELQNFINKNTDFIFNSFITWDKGDFRALSWKNPSKKNNLRSWFNTCEYCLYYTFQDKTPLRNSLNKDMDIFEPIFDYFSTEQKKSGLNNKQLDDIMGRKAAFSYFNKKTSHGIEFPTRKHYLKLQQTGYFQKPYEALKQEYEELKQKYEELRYTHHLDENHKNIWNSNIKNNGKLHPTQKPLDILERIIKTSSNENDTVLDCFMGSGSTGVACINTNRKFIGIEKDEKYFEIACDRIKEVEK